MGQSAKKPVGLDRSSKNCGALQKRIRQRLRELGLTAHSAATRIGAPPDLIRNVLRRDASYRPHPETIRRIANALSTTEIWLLTGFEPDAESARGFDRARHRKATEAAIQALEVSGLQLEPQYLSEMILRLYELVGEKERAKAF